MLDEKGIKTGKIKPREEIHRDGDWHRTVHVWILNSHSEILIQKRSATIDIFQNLWDISLAGHVRSREKSKKAAERELKEELGMNVYEDELQFIGTVKSALKDGEKYDNQFCDLYILKRDIDTSDIKKQKEELTEVKFMSLQELKTLVYKNPERFVPRAEEYEKMFGFFNL